jgi:gas vesicle protein
MANRCDRGRDILWFVSGSLLGAAAALLFAPQSGKETRRDIQEFGKNVWKRADRFTSDIQKSLQNLMEEVSDATQTALAAGRDISAKTKNEILDILESGTRFLEEEKKRWEKTLRG